MIAAYNERLDAATKTARQREMERIQLQISNPAREELKRLADVTFSIEDESKARQEATNRATTAVPLHPVLWEDLSAPAVEPRPADGEGLARSGQAA